MTLSDFIRLARGHHALGEPAQRQLDAALDGGDPNNVARPTPLAWLRQLEQVAWNDDELGDEVSGLVARLAGVPR